MESRSRNRRNSSPLRLFWGLAPAPGLRSRIASWRLEAEPLLPGARWAGPGDAHLTLAFLGPRPAAELDSILTAGRAALAGRSGFQIRSAGLGAFPLSRPSRVLWLGVEPAADLMTLAERLQGAMAPYGCRQEGPYRPHLTLARFRTPVRLPLLPTIESTSWEVNAVHLFLSEPQAEGCRYRSLEAVPLSASTPPAP